MDEVLERAREVDEVVSGIDERYKRIRLAEQRMARLDVLLGDMKSGLEALREQKVLVEHVLEKAGELTFQAKEAEALIVTLREEREITSRIHAALQELKAEEKKAG